MGGWTVGAAAGSGARRVMSQFGLGIEPRKTTAEGSGVLGQNPLGRSGQPAVSGMLQRQAGQRRATQAATGMDKELFGVGCHGR